MGRLRRPYPASVRGGATVRAAASPGDRTGSGMGARRDQHVSRPRVRWACHGGGPRVERCGVPRGLRGRSGGGWWCRWRRTNWERRPMRSRRPVPPRRKVRGELAGWRECRWQRDQLPESVRALVLDDQAAAQRPLPVGVRLLTGPSAWRRCPTSASRCFHFGISLAHGYGA